MIVLIANLGSTSFKYKLFDMPSERVLATGAADRIGQGNSAWSVEVPASGGATSGAAAKQTQGTTDLADHAAAIHLHLDQLKQLGAIQAITDVQAVGFKAVHGGPISGAVRVDEHVLSVMQQFADVAPAHNPPYIAAMRAFMAMLPGVPQVAAFETAFHQTIPLARQVYAIPHDWISKLGIRRYGFHGASHRYIATRMAEIAPNARKVISLHLGGSCSICAIHDGKSVANSFGMTAQSGVFHNNRVGEFDTFALLKLTKAGMSLEEIFTKLGKEGGLKGLSGVSADMRDVEVAAEQGNAQAKLALDAFVEVCRHFVGAYLAALNGADAIVFTGGIGQNGKALRTAICAGMDYAGIAIDPAKNLAAKGSAESRIEAASSKTQLWVLPTNEELIVARQTFTTLTSSPVSAH
jgi:acetate kinase